MKVYQDPNGDIRSILLVNKAGKIKKLYCPFRVICISSVTGIKKNTHVYVEAIISSEHGKIYYLILSQPYQHIHFHIVMHF